MTNTQIKFLESIYENDKNAEELCLELGIPGYENDELGGCYNALNNAINYNTDTTIVSRWRCPYKYA